MKPTDVSGIYKREDGVFVNRDDEKLEAYKKQKQYMREMKEKADKVDRLEESMNEMKQSLDLIKEILLNKDNEK